VLRGNCHIDAARIAPAADEVAACEDDPAVVVFLVYVIDVIAGTAFLGERTRGSIKTFPATAKTENTALYQ
jgi:hypothetical protein